MKRFSVKSVALLSMTAAALLILGCAGAPAPAGQGFAPMAESGVTVQGVDTVIIDWQGRAAGGPSVPAWVRYIGVYNDNDAAARSLGHEAGGVGAPIHRNIVRHGPDLRGAEMRADIALSRDLARELQQNVQVHLASAANSMSGPTTEALGERVQATSEVRIAAMPRIATFWQVVEIREPNRPPRRETILYRLYRIDAANWQSITQGYLQDVLGGLPVYLSPEQAQVQEMLVHTLQQSRAQEVLTAQQMQAQLAAQQQVVAQGNAVGADLAAFATSDPVALTVASTTAADAPAVEARALAFDAILF